MHPLNSAVSTGETAPSHSIKGRLFWGLLSLATVAALATVASAQTPPTGPPNGPPAGMMPPPGMARPHAAAPPPAYFPLGDDLGDDDGFDDLWGLLPAKTLFWQTFLNGDYNELDEATPAMTADYLAERDPQNALYLGMAHLWTLAESARDDDTDASITDELILAERYLEIAARLNPADARIPSWLGAVKLALAQLHDDPMVAAEGQALLGESIARYPEFGFFGAAFPLAGLPVDSPQFQNALELMWVGQNACLDTPLDRSNPDYTPYMSQATTVGPKKVCWNSDTVPHNLEGFLLAFGDMLLKAGDVTAARVIYNNARLSASYHEWPYRQELEDRLANLDRLAALLADLNPINDPQLSINSSYSCAMCHQK